MNMTIKNLIPWNRKDKRELTESNLDSPFLSLHREMNRLFDNFFNDFPSVSTGRYSEVSSFSPRINIAENEKEIRIEAELPGIDEKDLSVEIKGRTLSIHGERKAKKEEKKENYHIVESSYGSFYRSVELPEEADLDKVEAKSKDGITTIIIPKLENSKTARKVIQVKRSE
ncbi:MAG TPA: Hsp20/alpha crystallin family protein [Leptospiraceae bacterium]|nr:Hsp20/alpha crystallin family protein [Leptospiraceae bacterium]HNM03454.1 Hsp20/alpha crystallin family protein [Leptospiraceae bacterium]